METKLDLSADYIDVRDIMARVEELEAEAGELNETENFDLWAHTRPDDAAELATLRNILAELAGYGGDEQWRGDWYPVTLVRDGHFEEYVRELIEDCYPMPKEMNENKWPWRHMTFDYAAAAKEAQTDFTPIEIDGQTYWYR